MNLVNVLNTIYDNASEIYRKRIPYATEKNISDIQEAMTNPNNAVVTNEFLGTLLNQIILQVIHAKTFSDPLKSLKKGNKPLGDTVEEIYANFVQAKGFDPTGAELFQREIPDVKAVYHRMNRQDKYKVTISEEQLYKAFSSYEKLGSFIQSIINTLYNSSELDEYICMKELLKQAIDNKSMKVVTVNDPLLSEQNAKDFIKAVKTVSGDMAYPNSNNNGWLTTQTEDTKPLVTLSNKNEQVLIIDNATDVAVSIEVLAYAFNMTVAEFNDTRKIVVDAFPEQSMRACLVDEAFFQVFDDLVMFKEMENPEGLYKNYWLHIWQTLAYSPLVNAVAFCVGSDTDTDGTVETFDVQTTLKTGVTISNKKSSVVEGSSYNATLYGVSTGDTVAITMNGSNVTSTVYNSTTNHIKIATVTGAITITVS